jgi:hypothetical protein
MSEDESDGDDLADFPEVCSRAPRYYIDEIPSILPPKITDFALFDRLPTDSAI